MANKRTPMLETPSGVMPADRAQLERLARILRVVLPDTNLNIDLNDEGVAYAHLWTADDRLNYFIEWTGDVWEGKPRGRIGLPEATFGPSAGAVAMAAGGSCVTWLVVAAQAATNLLLGANPDGTLQA